MAVPSSRRPSLADHPAALRVAGHDRRLHAVQAQLLEAVAEHDRHRVGRVPAARVALVDPVADEARLERPAQHAAEAHLADERAVAQERAEAVRGVELALALPRAAAGTERLAVDGGIAGARFRERLPLLEPLAAADADLAPGVVVTRLQAAAASRAGRRATDSRRPLIRAKVIHYPDPVPTNGTATGSDDRLVWLDLEMTGLDLSRHVIVEIAALVTDGELTPLDDGIDVIVHQPPEALAEMDDFVRKMHTKSGTDPRDRGVDHLARRRRRPSPRVRPPPRARTRRRADVRQFDRRRPPLPRPAAPRARPLPPLPQHRRVELQGALPPLVPRRCTRSARTRPRRTGRWPTCSSRSPRWATTASTCCDRPTANAASRTARLNRAARAARRGGS